MEKILFGLAAGQILAVVLVIALELLVTTAFWYLLELLARGASTGFHSILGRLTQLAFGWRHTDAR